jgi:hypothetical protein
LPIIHMVDTLPNGPGGFNQSERWPSSSPLLTVSNDCR